MSPHTFKRDQAVRELVLDRLEFPDRLPELLALLGVVDGEIERAPGGTICTCRQCQPGRATDIAERDAIQGKKRQRGRRQPDLVETPGAHGAGRRDLDAGLIHPHERNCPFIDSEEQMGASSRRLDETKHTRPVHAVDPDCTDGRIRIERAEGERDTRRTGMQLLQQVHCDIGPRTRKRQIGQCRRPHRRRDRLRGQAPPSPPGFREGRPGRGSEPSAATPCPTSLLQIAEMSSAGAGSFPVARGPMRREKSAQGIPKHLR